MLAHTIMREVDTDCNGFISYMEFMVWPGRINILEWVDSYMGRIAEGFGPWSGIVDAPVRIDLMASARMNDVVMGATAGNYPWAGLTNRDIVRVFRSEQWAGSLDIAEFERVLGKLGLPMSCGPGLFDAFDQDGSGTLDFRETFVGLSLLLSGSMETRMECAFAMMDDNGSGRVSRMEVEVFLQSIAPRSVSRFEITTLASTIMREADTNRSGLITFQEFIMWPGKQAVLDWIDAYHSRILEAWTLDTRTFVATYPWENITSKQLNMVFRSESWTDELTLVQFLRVLEKLGIDGSMVGPRLFDAFDIDGSNTLDYRELFIGLALLMSASRSEKLEAVFTMMDTNNDQTLSREEIEVFLNCIAPEGQRSYMVIGAIAQRILDEADSNVNGFISFTEFNMWQGKTRILQWVDEYQQFVLGRFGNPKEPFVANQEGYPWDCISLATLVRFFNSEARGSAEGELNMAEFRRFLGRLGFGREDLVYAEPLFAAFDTDGSGKLDMKETFIGMALLLSNSYEERLESCFMMIDSNNSGRISRDEVEAFLQTIAPNETSSFDIRALSVRIMNEADPNRSGLVTYTEFMCWPGKQVVLNWIDTFFESVVSDYMKAVKGGLEALKGHQLPKTSSSFEAPVNAGAGYPWDFFAISTLVNAFRQESWGGSLSINDFRRVLDLIELDGQSLAKPLFACFDFDGSGSLDFREVFIGLALLLAKTSVERLQAVFMMIDNNGNGKI